MMRKTFKRLFAKVLFLCLIFQPTAPMVAPKIKIYSINPHQKNLGQKIIRAMQTRTAPLQEPLNPISLILNSPTADEPGQQLILPDKDPSKKKLLSQPQQLSKQQCAWIHLIKDLQFDGEPDARSILTQAIPTITKSGKTAFLNLITQGNNDVATTKTRQAFIRALISDPELLKTIRNHLKTIKTLECVLYDKAVESYTSQEVIKEIFIPNKNNLLIPGVAEFVCAYLGFMWATINPLHKQEWPQSTHLKILPLKGPIFKNANTFRDAAIYNAAILAMVSGYYSLSNLKKIESLHNIPHAIDTGLLLASFMMATTDTCSTITELRMLKKGPRPLSTNAEHDIQILEAGIKKFKCPSYQKMLADITTTMRDQSPSNRKIGKMFFSLFPSVVAALATGNVLYEKFSEYKINFEKAQKIATLTRALHNLQEALKSHEDEIVKNAYGTHLTSLLSKTWPKLKRRAFSSTFNPTIKWNALRAVTINHARVNNLLEDFEASQKDIQVLAQFYGELDVYAALAQKFIDSEASINKFEEPTKLCFADFIESSQESIIIAKNMWHPIIPQNRVVTNSLSLGDSPQNPRNAIITGPNAAGKSVNMKGLVVNLILSQIFGLACAESFKFTLYKKIIARFTSADNTANDQSKFMLEATDTVNLLKELDELVGDEKAFIVTDELFSGTELKPAVLLSLELCKRIGKKKNVSYLLATHYKDLTRLKETTGNAFENYKVTAFKTANNKVAYPFKLTHGIGDVNVAFDIFLDQMEQQGMRDETLESIIKDARDLENNVMIA